MAKDDSIIPRPAELAQEVDRLFDELIHRPWGFARSTADLWSPELDLYETDTAFILEADLPGVKDQDVSVVVEQGELVLRGTRSATHTTTQGTFYYNERRSGSFARRLRLPTSVDQDHIRAEFTHGVLRVTLPKVRRERSA
jgi:HSP20 family protein